VGSFKNGTMLMMLMSSRLVADICVVLKTLPTREAVSSLAKRVFDELKKTITNVNEVRSKLKLVSLV
jgi:hypothetical protein